MLLMLLNVLVLKDYDLALSLCSPILNMGTCSKEFKLLLYNYFATYPTEAAIKLIKIHLLVIFVKGNVLE